MIVYASNVMPPHADHVQLPCRLRARAADGRGDSGVSCRLSVLGVAHAAGRVRVGSVPD